MARVLPPPIDHFLVQADLTVVVPGPLQRHLAEELSAVATVESAGTAMVYRVSEQSIRHALDIGKTADELHNLFHKHSKTPVPQGLTYLIDDVARRHGQLRVGMATSFVRCEDPALLAQAVAGAEHLGLRVLAPTVAISQAPISEVLAALQDAGFAPAAEDSTGTIVDIRARGARVPAPQRHRPHRPTPRPSNETLSAVVAVLRKVTAAPFGSVRIDPAVAMSLLQRAAGRTTTVLINTSTPPGWPRSGWYRRSRWPAVSWWRSTRPPAGPVSSPSTASPRSCRPRTRTGVSCRRLTDNGDMTDGPLIVQSDKTVLLEVDHELAGAARAAIAPFAELERAPEHVHTYRITPLALWNARAAGHDAEQVVDALVSFSRYAVPQPLLVDIVDTMARYGRLQLVKSPVHGLTLVSLDRAVLEEVLRHKKIAPMLGARIDDDTVIVHPSERGRVKQMLLKIGWPAEDLAGYVDGEAHPISLAPGRLAPARLPGDGGRLVLVGRLGRGGPAVWCRQDARRRRRDGEGQRDDADSGHQHRRGPAVETRTDRPNVVDRGGDRRILRRTQGDSAGHHRDLSGDHPPHQGRIPPPGAVRQPRLGADHLRRGAPAAGAGVPDDRRSAVPAAARVDRDADPRGRPRGRRVLVDRPEAL